jgi:hypothetical protein
VTTSETVLEVTQKLHGMLLGGVPELLAVSADMPDEARALAEATNCLSEFMAEINAFILPLSRGELVNLQFQRPNYLASPFKELLSRLRHLTWQAQRVAEGDYGQRVDFMGDFAVAFNDMVEALERNERELREKIAQLEDTISHVKRLEGLLPICANCKRIRRAEGDSYDPGSWQELEEYVREHTDADFTHGVCPECMRTRYPEFFHDRKKAESAPGAPETTATAAAR